MAFQQLDTVNQACNGAQNTNFRIREIILIILLLRSRFNQVNGFTTPAVFISFLEHTITLDYRKNWETALWGKERLC